MSRLLFDFLLGTLTDVAWVVWANAATKGKPIRAGLVSMGLGTAGLLGMNEALNHGGGAALVLGYGVGTYLATRYHKKRRRIELVGA
jgi:hypothetical protein